MFLQLAAAGEVELPPQLAGGLKAYRPAFELNSESAESPELDEWAESPELA
jgi:hypothetical protein